MNRLTFTNLPVKDLDKSKEFYSQLGFEFNPDFSGENCVCLVISEGSYSMLMTESFFQMSTNKEIADATKTTEVVVALSTESREEVDAIVDKALSTGSSEPVPTEDQPWMYCRTFQDPDGHVWQLFHMSQGEE